MGERAEADLFREPEGQGFDERADRASGIGRHAVEMTKRRLHNRGCIEVKYMSVKMNIPFSPPDVGEEEIEETIKALRSGWITTGPRTKELEKEIAAYIGTEKCVCLNSQTACAEMALRVLGVKPGDEVITV